MPTFARLLRKPSSRQVSSSSSNASTAAALKADYARSKEIERRLWEDKRKADKEIKIILLGAGESGKSTIVKQMRIIYRGGFSDAERRSWKNIILQNLQDAFLDIFGLMNEQGNTFLEDSENLSNIEMLQGRIKIGPNEPFPSEYFDCFSDLWADTGVQMALLKGNECALHDNLIYFIENLDRIFDRHYLPTDADILRTRYRTTGIVESTFDMGQYMYRMVDVGGQRSERKKWIHAFDNVKCVLFVAAVSGYDQALVEDREGNQMTEALGLFDEIANLQTFRHASIILFLNKYDLLEEKITSGISPIDRYYPDFIGTPRDTLSAGNFFYAKFKRRYKRGGKQKELYMHFTTATDTRLLKITMKSVDQTILHHNLTTQILL